MTDYKGKALIADDEVDIRNIIKRKLEKESYEVIQCVSYDEAHRVLITEGKAKGLDLVILDGQMPPMPDGKHGSDLAEEVKSLNPSLYVALFTSDQPSRFEHLLSRGIKLYRKPDVSELITGIMNDLGGN